MMLVFGAAAAATVGAVYGALTYWIPFVYLNFFGTIGLGLAAGGAVYLGAVFGKVRNTTVSGLGGVVAGLAALWGAWVVWIYVVTADADTGVILLSPASIWRAMGVIGAHGVWSIGRSSSTPVSGTTLYVVWVIEALIVLGVSAFISHVFMVRKPFCERCNSWVNRKNSLPKLSPPEDASTLDGLDDGDISGILTLEGNPMGSMHLQVDLQACRTCDEMHLMSISAVVESRNDKGEKETSTSCLLKNMRLSAADYQALLAFKGAAPASPPVPAPAPTPAAAVDPQSPPGPEA
jgi:hypothetical protein